MNVVVLVKQIPDPNNPYQLEGNRLKRAGVQNVLDPGDEFGVEAGLKLTEGGGEVTVVSMGPASAMEAIRKALSMGAAKGILVTDDSLAGADALVTARVLAAAIKKVEAVDLVICGVESTDGSAGVLPGMIAELLGMPQVTFAKHLELKDGTLTVNRQTVAGYDVVECPLPAVLSVTAGVNEPRYPTFKGIMQAKSKPVEQLSVGDLGLSGDDVKATQEVAGVNPAPARGAGEKFEDDGTGAAKIADFLKNAKVI
jgi:electron transfer flavoprotein beta subunit